MKKKFFNKSIIFVLGDVLNKAVPFLLLPILTRYLSPSDYGLIASFMILIPVFGIILGFGSESSIFSNYFRMDKNNLKIFIGNVLYLVAFSFILLVLVFFLLISENETLLGFNRNWLFLALILSLSQLITTMNLRLWIAEEKPMIYSIYQVLQTFLSAILSLVLVIYFNMKWEGYLLGYSVSIFFFSLISFIIMFKRGYLKFSLNVSYIKDALKFGLPLVPNAAANWMKSSSDRVIILYIIGSYYAGIYSVAFQFAMVITIIATGFNKAWSSFLFKKLSSSPTYQEKIQLVKYIYIYFVVILIFATIYSEIAYYFIPYILGDSFIDSRDYILFLSLSFAFQGMYFMVTSFIFYEKKTGRLSLVTLSTSLLHLVLLIIMIFFNGIDGVVQAILASYIIIFIAAWRLSHIIYPMPWFSFTQKNNLDNING